ncbi:hypothetical protein [Paenibacillus thalictri]|uniref:Uncharacterized protein n=1 Tax=Paenibacillus thalictri TaxID=2527873 RepID=A0A4Q9DHG6_9BACL|nr:hypothetical protein [Paenibacillus thalictri]TBL69695.1 hypothetical protein EYB31_35535 [Paenibacillus thalictri]
MSESLTHTAAVEDMLRLAFASPELCVAFQEVCREHPQFAQFGGLVPADGGLALRLLDKYRDNWESHKTVKEEIGFRSAPLVPKTAAESSLAFALGWICYRAAERALAPVSEEAAMYRDAYVFHRLYVNNDSTPDAYRTADYERGMERLPAAAAVGSKETAEFFAALQQRFFIEMHTFVPDVEDIEGWFDRLHVSLDDWSAGMERFAEALMNPDLEKAREYVAGSSFYDDGDVLIQAAARLRRGEQLSVAELEAALAAEPASEYARAVKAGLTGLLNASAFFSGRLDREAFQELLAV